MVTKELIKTEIDKVREDNLKALYSIVKALQGPAAAREAEEDWHRFVASTYGSLADAQIERSGAAPEEGRNESPIPTARGVPATGC